MIILDYEKSYEYYLHALRIYESAYAADHVNIGLVTRALGRMSYFLGEYEESLAHLRRSCVVLQLSNGGANLENVQWATSQCILAANLHYLDRNDEAADLMDEVIKTARYNNGLQGIDLEQCLYVMGNISLATQEFNEAKLLYTELLHIYESRDMGEQALVANVLNQLGKVFET